jgi:signal transduction histidine kinase/ActR/RegA family two-component response regulator
MQKRETMPRRSEPIWIGYAVAVAAFLVAALARWLLSRFFGGVYPYAPIFLAVIFTAWYGGFGPALLVAALGLAHGYLASIGGNPNAHPLFGLALYAITSLGIALIGGAMARARAKIAHQVEELQRKHQELTIADHRKDEFLAVLAHELRNALAPIASALDILKQPEVDPAVAAKAVEVADRQIHQMTRLVDDLLDVSRIMRGKIELRKERVGLESVVERAVETVQPLIDRERHELTIELPEDTVWIEADLVRLAQAVANLLSNAAKYTEPGGQIHLNATAENGQLVICVRDSGIGIDPATLPKLFEMFMQAAPGSTRSRGGLGIGLTLVKNLVELHGGAIVAHSEGIGKGSEFMIRMPHTQMPPMEVARAPIAPSGKGPRRQILVVDDNVDAAQSLAMLLRLRGHDVHTAFGGPQALEAAKHDEPELVFLDIGMPVMDGYEVARRLRAQFGSEITIIALTGWGTEQDRQRSRQAGFDHHMTKPVDLAALEEVLAAFAAREEQANRELEASKT